MSIWHDAHATTSTSRPVLLGEVSPPRSISKRSGRTNQRVEYRNPSDRIARLDARFTAAMRAFDNEVGLATSIQAADPQLVLVFEAIDESIDLESIAKKIGFEIVNRTGLIGDHFGWI